MLDLHWGKRGVQAHDSVCRIDVAVASRALCLVRLVLLSFLSSLGGWNKRESPPGASGAGTSVIPPAPVGVPPDPAKIIYNIVNGARALGHPLPPSRRPASGPRHRTGADERIVRLRNRQ